MYFSLLQFFAQHDYFKDSQLTTLRYGLSDDSQHLLDNCGAIFKKHSSGFEVVASDDTLEHFKSLVKAYHKQRDLPPIDGISADKIPPLFPPQIIIKAFHEPTDFSLITEHLPKPGQTCVVVTNTVQFSPEGSLHSERFIAKSDLQPIEDIASQYQFSRNERHHSPVMVISLLLEHIVEHAANGTRPIQYQVTFAVKQNFWQYIVFGHEKFSDINVIDLDQQIDFKTIDIPWPDISKPKVFISQSPIKLQKHANYQFQLQDENQQMTNVIIEQLPVAGANQIPRGPLASGEPLVSEIYVNL